MTFKKAITPVQNFLRTEAASGVILGIATVLALIAANSPLRDAYDHLLHVHARIGIGPYELDESLLHWINDGLMAIFFLLVGLEIKREIRFGELSDAKAALLPAVGAVGGAVVPALIFWFFNAGTEYLRGWAVPMATDIAFALGVVALLGNRVPAWVKVFLMALAVVDDLIAVLVIAIFYTENLHFGALAVAGVSVAALVALNLARVRRLWAYLLVGSVLWVAVLESGIHATVAGVILGLSMPAFLRRMVVSQNQIDEEELEVIRGPYPLEETKEESEQRQMHLQELEAFVVDHTSPLHRLEHKLHPFVAFVIMPIFAFANAGVTIEASSFSGLTSPLGLGVILGLFVGKQIGIFGSVAILIRMGLTKLTWNRQTLSYVHGASLVAGIGFTMSLFIAALAYGEGEILDEAKIAILAASLLSGVAGYLLLARMKPVEASDEQRATSVE